MAWEYCFNFEAYKDLTLTTRWPLPLISLQSIWIKCEVMNVDLSKRTHQHMNWGIMWFIHAIRANQYCGVIMSGLAPQITGFSIVCSIVYSDADQRNIKAPRHWPSWRKCFHLTTSSRLVSSLCEGNSLVTGEFPAQMASNAENASISLRHHVTTYEWGSHGGSSEFNCYSWKPHLGLNQSLWLWVLDYWQKCMFQSNLVINDFQTWLLIGWWLCF